MLFAQGEPVSDGTRGTWQAGWERDGTRREKGGEGRADVLVAD